MLPSFSNPLLYPQCLAPVAFSSTHRNIKFSTQPNAQRFPPPLRSQAPAIFRPRATMRFPPPLRPPPVSSFHPAYVAAAAALYQQYVDSYRSALLTPIVPPPPPSTPALQQSPDGKLFIDDNKKSSPGLEIVAVDDLNILTTGKLSDDIVQERFERLKNESKLEDVTVVCEKIGNAWTNSQEQANLDDTISLDLNGRRFKRKLSDAESLKIRETKKIKCDEKVKKPGHSGDGDRVLSPIRKQSMRRYKFASLKIGDFHFKSSADSQLSHIALYHRLNQMIYEFNYKRNFGVKSHHTCGDDDSMDDHQYHHHRHQEDDNSPPEVRQDLNVVVTIIVPLNSIQRLTTIDAKTISLEINETPRIITRLQNREQWSKIFGRNSYPTTIDVTDGQLALSRHHKIVLARSTCASLMNFFAYFEPHIVHEQVTADESSTPPVFYDICSPREIKNSESLIIEELSDSGIEEDELTAQVKLVINSILGTIK